MMRIVIALVALLVVAAGVVVVINGKGATKVAEPANVDKVTEPANVDNNPVVMVAAEKHVFDCADADYIESTYADPKQGGKIVDVLIKGEASEGAPVRYLQSPKWVNKCGLDEIKETPGVLHGLAVYNFNVEREDDFYVFVRAKWIDTCANSCWILMDGPEKGSHNPKDPFKVIEDQLIMNPNNTKEYRTAWHPLVVQKKPWVFHLKPGPHRVEIHTREDGPRFDQILVSTDANTPIDKPMPISVRKPSDPVSAK